MQVIDGLYVHVPFCDGKCHYCAFYSVPYTRELGQSWLAAVTEERNQVLQRYGTLPVSTIFMGGGTPTLLPLDQLQGLLTLLRDSCWSGEDSSPDPAKQWIGRSAVGQALEWTSEANPGSITVDKLSLMKSFGVNRISLGVQAFSNPVLRQLGRRHSVADIHAAVKHIRSVGLSNWGLDLIACIPGVSESVWRETLETALALEPKHISVYALTREEGTRLNQECEAGATVLIDEDEQLRMLDLAESILGEAGFGRYEISNYALPGFECRHNVSCWRGGNYLGLGCAAASRVGDQRWTNAADLKAYIRGCGQQDRETLTPMTDAVERLVFGLRMAEGVDLEAILSGVGLAQTKQAVIWRTTLERLGRAQLVCPENGHWRLTPKGRALADYVAVELMP
jgi:oxygen-independent coproporphyrinogen-3 oxidase